MSAPPYDELKLGDELPPLVLPPLSRTTLALYAGGSGDHVPLHIDLDFAKQAGYPDVFMHGMLGMAYLGRLLTQWVPQAAVRRFNARFSAIVWPGDVLSCTGKVVEKLTEGGERLVRLRLALRDAKGEVKTSGEAVVALP